MAETLFGELDVDETFTFLSPRSDSPTGIFRKTDARHAQHTDYDYVTVTTTARAHVLRIALDEPEGSVRGGESPAARVA